MSFFATLSVLFVQPHISIKEEKTEMEDQTSLDLKHSLFATASTAAGGLYPPSSHGAPLAGESDASSNNSYGDGSAPGAPPTGGNLGGIIGSDGRIDLNFYLQQAIQCASMPCPLCKKVGVALWKTLSVILV